MPKKLKEETRQKWAEKFGVHLFEGYGATETSSVINQYSMQNKPEPVGQLLPGITSRLEPVEGIVEGARVCGLKDLM